jgi:hypothetical protein
LTLLKSDPMFDGAGVVKAGVEVAVVSLGLPKVPKNPGAFRADVAGAVVVALGRVGAGNAPKSGGALGGSV